MHKRTMIGRLLQGTAALTICLLLLPGCGDKGKGKGPVGKDNGKTGSKPGAGAALTLSADAAILVGADATDKAIRELVASECTGDAGKGLAKAQALLGNMPADDTRRKGVEEAQQRLKEAGSPSDDLVAAVLALGSEDVEARKTGREKIASAGPAGQFHLRNMFWSTSNRLILFEAARILRQNNDFRAFPLMVARFRTDPDDPLRYEMVRGMAKIIGLHSGNNLKPADLMELLIVAEEAGDPLTGQMLRSLAAAWDPGELNASIVKQLPALLANDNAFERRHIASFLGIVYTASCDSDAQKFQALAGSDALGTLQKYVADSMLIQDEKIKSWGAYAGPMLGMVDTQALRKGLLLYFDFNEPIMKNNRYFICLRDQSAKVTGKSPRGWLKGVLAEEGSRVQGVRGNGIKFVPEGLVEFPPERKFRELMKESYSYAIWIKPTAKPTIAPMPPWVPYAAQRGDGAEDIRQKSRASRSRWETAKREKAYALLIGKMSSRIGLSLNKSLQIEFLHRSSRGSTKLKGATRIPLNRWTHVAATVDVPTDSVKLYINGKFEPSKRSFQSVAAGASSMSNLFGAIGGAQRNASRYSHGFVGVIDEARAYTRALSDSEVRGLHSGFLPESE